MKRVLSAILLLLLSLPAFAAGTEALKVKNMSLRKAGSEVVVTLDMDIDGFNQNHKVIITPVLHNGQSSVDLESMTVIGRKKAVSDERAGIVNANAYVVRRSGNHSITYTAAVPYQDWMQYVSLSVFQMREGCNCDNGYYEDVLVENKLIYFEPAPQFVTDHIKYELTELEQYDLDNPFLHAMEDYGGRYDILLHDRERHTSKVIFKVGKSDIDIGIPGNRQTLDAIAKAFDLIQGDPNAVLKHIVVAGYASPEGPLSTNTRLAQARAEVVKKFILSHMDKPQNNIFELYNGREDWGGLRAMAAKSSMEDKTEIIAIIDGYTMEQEIRKTKLKQFKGGVPYKYMLENFYPSLRTGGYVQVYYEIDRRGTTPAAVTDSKGNLVWVDPDSPVNRGVTAINKAIDKMAESEYGAALDLLMEFEDDPRSWNLIGVCNMMKGDYAAAERYLEKADGAGDRYAAENLRQIKLKKTVE